MNNDNTNVPFREICRNSIEKMQNTPSKFFSPSPPTKEKLGDRFIPCRVNTQFNFLNDTENDAKHFEPYSQILHSQLFESELNEKNQNVLKFKAECRRSAISCKLYHLRSISIEKVFLKIKFLL